MLTHQDYSPEPQRKIFVFIQIHEGLNSKDNENNNNHSNYCDNDYDNNKSTILLE